MHDDHLTESELAGFLDGALDGDTLHRLERHLDACDDCRAELVAVARLLESADTTQHRKAAPRPRRRWRVSAAGGALVAVAAMALLVLVTPDGEPVGSAAVDRQRVTDPAGALLPAHGPADGAAVARGVVAFAWAGYGADTYRVTVTTEDGAVTWSHATADTVAVPPAGVGLEPGATYFWYVDAIAGGIVARSDVRSFTVAP
jgi:anti-sigma factor RsiW